MENLTKSRESVFSSVEEAFKKYSQMVYRLAFVRTRSRSDSDDILQEVFLRYMKVCHKMESEEHIKAMLLRITVNCSNSFFANYRSGRLVPLENDLPVDLTFNDDSVLNQVLALPIKYRTAIHLFYYCGYSVKEIAEIEGIKISTVKTHLSRAREMLKIKLTEEDYYV